MAGGVGSRFWPGSREAHPKQFLDMLGTGKSLLRQTYERFLPICPSSNIYIVANAKYRDLILEQLPELKPSQILCEPDRRNTAPAIAYTAFKLAAIDPGANMIVAPSDHLILQEDEFRRQIGVALEYATGHNALLTLGLRPSRPDTGYGYIQFGEEVQPGVRRVLRFTEKPDSGLARTFVESGEYLWNAGIFVWSLPSVLRALETLAPDIHAVFRQGEELYNTREEQAFIDRIYPTLHDISVDYALLEPASNVYTVPSDFGWSDLGTWASLHTEVAHDPNGNALQGHRILALDTENCLVRVPADKLVVLKDLHNYIVVDTGDVLLVYPKDKEQEIKQVTGVVKARFGGGFL